jgi:uncharacterized protein (TIGR02186 family)
MVLGPTTSPSPRPPETRVETRYGVSDVVVSRIGRDYLDYRRAVIRLKQASGLYAADSNAVRFVDQGLFRADIQLPSSAPSGRYVADILLFRRGQPIASRTRTLTVEKVGVERTLSTFARDRPWSYGVLSVAFGLFAGWAPPSSSAGTEARLTALAARRTSPSP